MRFSMTLRTQVAAAALALVAVGAHAGNTTINTTALVANSVQAFSADALGAFEVGQVSITPLGNASAVDGVTGAFALPITTITLNSKLAIVSGDAKGSALRITRPTDTGDLSVYIANFTLDYVNKKVLADTTPSNTGVTVKQMPIYTFNVNTPLSIKYKFPLAITGHEVLDQLTFTPEATAAMNSGLVLNRVLRAALASITSFGTLTQDVNVKFRAKAVSATPYTPPVTTTAAQ